MGLFDFLKKKRQDADAETERGLPVTLEGFDPDAVTPPDTRYTQEYQDFLAAQEAAGQNRDGTEVAPEAEAIPCGERAEKVLPEEIREYCDVVEEAAEEAEAGKEIPEEVSTEKADSEADGVPDNE